jgi:hypothetical protein
MTLSYTWVKKALQGAGLVRASRKRGPHRSRRERRPLPRMLLHSDNPQGLSNMAPGYFGAVDGDSEDRIFRPASVYCPSMRTVAMASKVTGTHIPPSCANCRVI